MKSQNCLVAKPSAQSTLQQSNFGNNGKILRKGDIKVFWSCPMLLNFFTLGKILHLELLIFILLAKRLFILTPWKRQKTIGFLTFLGRIEMTLD